MSTKYLTRKTLTVDASFRVRCYFRVGQFVIDRQRNGRGEIVAMMPDTVVIRGRCNGVPSIWEADWSYVRPQDGMVYV